MSLKNNKYLKIRNKFKYIVFLLVYFSLYPLSKLCYGRKNNWLVCERGYDAQDNGYFFFKFLREKHSDINPVFLIKRDSPDFEKVNKIGRTVEFGSLKHFLMAIGFPAKISSHLFGYAPWIQMVLYFRRNKTHDIHVFLQHGITKNELGGLHGNACKSLTIFVCGAKPEYDFIKETFDYYENIPNYTGLSRYDNLLSFKSKNQILYMPTWRRGLNDLTDDEFVKSNYFKKWNDLLKSEKIVQKCEKNSLIIKFYLHANLQKYSSLFKDTQHVKIVNFGEEDVQTLLKESKLLVTDYSSVYFDFAYMKKPIVFYQFDESEYYMKHYSKGYFDYRKDGFGDVCTDSETLINSISKIIDNNFKMEEKYLQKVDDNFVYRDQNNSSRIFSLIKTKLEK